jgi:hypothetical protein
MSNLTSEEYTKAIQQAEKAGWTYRFWTISAALQEGDMLLRKVLNLATVDVVGNPWFQCCEFPHRVAEGNV